MSQGVAGAGHGSRGISGRGRTNGRGRKTKDLPQLGGIWVVNSPTCYPYSRQREHLVFRYDYFVV